MKKRWIKDIKLMIAKKISQEQKFPNCELIKNLYQIYYVKEGSGDGQGSSHWRQYSHNLEINLGTAGVPAEMVGYGFGDLQIDSLPYQALSLVAVLIHLARLPNRLDLIFTIPVAWRLAHRMGLSFTQDVFRQLCALALIKRNMSSLQRKKRLRILMIGDGYGFLASLFKETYPNSTIVLVDLGKVLLFQAYYCQRAHPSGLHKSVLEGCGDNLDECDFIYCPAEYLDGVSRLSYDLAINISSMQEMTIGSVTEYFRFLRQHMETDGLFYCCNRERKMLVGGEVQEFARYPWHGEDVHVVDEHCPWYKSYLSFATNSNGPKLLGVRIPFMNYYDGPVWHRLTRLSRQQ